MKIGDRVGVKWIAYACGNCCMLLPLRFSVFFSVSSVYVSF